MTGSPSDNASLQSALDAKAPVSTTFTKAELQAGACGAGYYQYGVDTDGSPLCRAEPTGTYTPALTNFSTAQTPAQADLNGARTYRMTSGTNVPLTLPTAAANLFADLANITASNIVVRPASASDVLTIDGTALTAGYKANCPKGLHRLIGTGANAWDLWTTNGTACSDGGLYFTSLGASPASWDPVDAAQGTGNATQTVTFTATGTVVVSGVSIVTTGQYFTDAGTGSCNANPTMTDSQTCTVDLVFAYTAAGGPYSDTLRITHDGPNSPKNVSLGPVTVSSGSECTGNEVFAAHFENNNDVTVGSPSGCSVGTASITRTNATFSSTAGNFVDGSYGLLSAGFNHYTSISTDIGDLTAKGSVSVWMRKSNGSFTPRAFRVLIDSTHYIECTTSGGKARLAYHDGTNTSSIEATQTCADETVGCWHQYGWDFTQTSGSDIIRSRTCDDAACSGDSWNVLSNKTVLDIGDVASATYYIGASGGSGTTNHSNIDDLKVFLSADCTQ